MAHGDQVQIVWRRGLRGPATSDLERYNSLKLHSLDYMCIVLSGTSIMVGDETCWGTPRENTRVNYSCSEGFHLMGPSVLICRNGTWMPDPINLMSQPVSDMRTYVTLKLRMPYCIQRKFCWNLKMELYLFVVRSQATLHVRSFWHIAAAHSYCFRWFTCCSHTYLYPTIVDQFEFAFCTASNF